MHDVQLLCFYPELLIKSTKTTLYSNINAGTVQIDGDMDAQSQAFTVQLNQTEIGGDGMLVVADSANYVKIKRTTSEPIIDIKTDKAYPALRITNANASMVTGHKPT